MRRPVVKPLSILRLFVGMMVLILVDQTNAICENVTPKNDVTFSIISPRDGSLWVGTASRGLLRVGTTGKPFSYSTLTGHLKCDSIVSLAFDENGVLWVRDGRDVVLSYSTLEGFVQCSEVPDSIREELFPVAKEEVEEPVVCEAKKPVIWPWILVITCLAAVIVFLLLKGSCKRQIQPSSTTVPASSESPLKPSEKVVNKPQKEAAPSRYETLFEVPDFEAKVKDLVEKNYTNKDYSVDQIAAELGISRVHLSLKLKALSAAAPSDMIKERRMKAAADMLRSGEKNMATVAASCGFASSAYFSSAFKAFYGVSPSAFK